jgi:hypothetical protein
LTADIQITDQKARVTLPKTSVAEAEEIFAPWLALGSRTAKRRQAGKRR